MLFVDTSFILGYYIETDRFHSQSNDIYNLIRREELLINNVVINEVLNVFKNNKFDTDVDEIFNSFIKSYTIDYLTPEDYKTSLTKLKWYNQSINYNDCCMLTTMEKCKVTDIVSFDSDFDKIKGLFRIYL